MAVVGVVGGGDGHVYVARVVCTCRVVELLSDVRMPACGPVLLMLLVLGTSTAGYCKRTNITAGFASPGRFSMTFWAVSYTHLTLPTIYSV